jgi:hypothetical protein
MDYLNGIQSLRRNIMLSGISGAIKEWYINNGTAEADIPDFMIKDHDRDGYIADAEEYKRSIFIQIGRDPDVGSVIFHKEVDDDTAADLPEGFPAWDDIKVRAKEIWDKQESAYLYRYPRNRAYKKIVEQLDDLWHDIDDGLLGEAAKTGQFYLDIKAVKDENPKTLADNYVSKAIID